MTIESGALYVVATPVGNLADLSERAREVLTGVAWVAAEDTRHSQPLLRHVGSRARLLAAHEHNEREAAARIVELLSSGEAVALVSDAGTPGVSDPGARVVAAVRAAGHRVIPLPGPCAAVVALSASGFDDPHFLFYGFLPPKAVQRRQALAVLKDQPWTVVFYEAPHRVLETVSDLAALFGERRLLIGRELTKLFETIAVLPLPEAVAWLQADPHRLKGEFVLAVSAAPAVAASGEGERALRLLLADGLSVSQAAKLAAAISGVGRKELYETALRLKGDSAT
ncbi:MAG: 16S rRNA (cytidine(1402)-2'-O)-methyltransferase [Dechloromonas sp.]|jgi:16S rRNA (cytidine1402-2'-O)-methyltransferase|nr:16S rRNA (cytidine(1402)-2'-O)-methyltransferase [Dechloromonas sp.]